MTSPLNPPRQETRANPFLLLQSTFFFSQETNEVGNKPQVSKCAKYEHTNLPRLQSDLTFLYHCYVFTRHGDLTGKASYLRQFFSLLGSNSRWVSGVGWNKGTYFSHRANSILEQRFRLTWYFLGSNSNLLLRLFFSGIEFSFSLLWFHLILEADATTKTY